VSGQREPVYESDPGAPPDSEYEPGEAAHIVPGNRGRLLDPRRTPLVIAGAVPARAAFEVVVAGFEDAGARWELALPEIHRMQFERGGPRLAPAEQDALAALAEGAQQPLAVPAPAAAREATMRLLAAERAELRARITGDRALRQLDLDACVRARRGSDAAAAALSALLHERELEQLERSFSHTYVSNPSSGEVVKGHAIVLAELGLSPFQGTVVRDPELFSGTRSRERRSEHILLRLAFCAELMALLGREQVELYRGIAAPVAEPNGGSSSLVAASFSREVALSHFDAAPGGVLARRRVPVSRLLMSFLETPAMNEPYREAEALLIGDPHSEPF
jgi:hypothetical protein